MPKYAYTDDPYWEAPYARTKVARAQAPAPLVPAAPVPNEISPYPIPKWFVQGEDVRIKEKCFLCHRVPVKGDLVLVTTALTPVGIGWYVQHEMCMQLRLQDTPPESYTKIKERLQAGGPLFDE